MTRRISIDLRGKKGNVSCIGTWKYIKSWKNDFLQVHDIPDNLRRTSWNTENDGVGRRFVMQQQLKIERRAGKFHCHVSKLDFKWVIMNRDDLRLRSGKRCPCCPARSGFSHGQTCRTALDQRPRSTFTRRGHFLDTSPFYSPFIASPPPMLIHHLFNNPTSLLLPNGQQGRAPLYPPTRAQSIKPPSNHPATDLRAISRSIINLAIQPTKLLFESSWKRKQTDGK